MVVGKIMSLLSINSIIVAYNERLVYGWRKIMENITRGYGHHE